MTRTPQILPEWSVSRWFNTRAPLSLGGLRGRVVVIEAFQMLCPGCVSHGLPQAGKVAAMFRSEDVAVVGLHTVFEHHDVQGRDAALEAFLHEYRISFPVGVDAREEGARLPTTMARYGLRGTPSILIVGRDGVLRAHEFGQVAELWLGAQIGAALAERPAAASSEKAATAEDCADGACAV